MLILLGVQGLTLWTCKTLQSDLLPYTESIWISVIKNRISSTWSMKSQPI